MSRGPEPVRAKEEALPIAGKRGLVQRYQHAAGTICDFTIMSPGLVSFVWAMRLLRLSCSPLDILHDFDRAINQLRFIASSPAISRELWLRTPRGAWRFFRILDDGILELDRDGVPLANVTGPVKDPASGASPGLVARLKRALGTGKRLRSRDGKSAGTDGAEPGKDPVVAAVPAQPLDTTSVPVTDPAPEKVAGTTTLPANVNRPANGAGTARGEEGRPSGPGLPEKIPAMIPGSPPSACPATEPEQEKIPDIIKKFLRRRNKGH